MAKSLKLFLLLSVIASTFAVKDNILGGAGNFSLDLYKNLVAEHPQENVVINPLNCFATIVLIYLGSEGETFSKLSSAWSLEHRDNLMARFYQILENGDSDSLFNISNNIFLAEGIKTKPSFEQLADSFNVHLKHIKFTNNDAAITQINDWIKERSSNALSNIVPPNYVIDSQTTALILNAVSFKGKWKLNYYDKQTSEEVFWVHDDKQVKTSMISATFHTKFKDFGNFTAITLPYKGTDLIMLVILPKERYGLSDLEQNLDFNEVYKTLMELKTFKYVRVQLPIFKSYFTGYLRSYLSKMNLGAVFDDSANFNSVGSNVKFSEFIHKMYFSIDEGDPKHMLGTMKPKLSFLADHPFLYYIMTPKGIIHMVGRYIGPLDK